MLFHEPAGGKSQEKKKPSVKHANHGRLLQFSFLLDDAKQQHVTRQKRKKGA